MNEIMELFKHRLNVYGYPAVFLAVLGDGLAEWVEVGVFGGDVIETHSAKAGAFDAAFF